MPAKDRNLPVNFEKCGKSVVKAHIASHRKTCMIGTFYCKKKNFNFSTKNFAELSYHIAKAHGAKVRNTLTKRVVCQKQFPSFYSLQFHRKKYMKLAQNLGSQAQTEFVRLWRKLIAIASHWRKNWQRVSIYLTIAKHGRQEIFNFSLSDLDTKEINEKLDEVFANLNCAAKINLALGFLLQIKRQTITDIIIHLKITYCWTEFFCWAIKTIYQTFKRKLRSWLAWSMYTTTSKLKMVIHRNYERCRLCSGS